MSNKYKNIDLYLPDYIRNKLTDNNLINKIKNELELNHSFKAEYDNLKSTMDFMDTISLSKPSELYFNSLIPKINEKIDLRTANKSIFKFFISSFENYWKYLLPVIPVILIILIYKIDFKQPLNTGDNQNQNNINKQESLITDSSFNSDIKKEEFSDNTYKDYHTENDVFLSLDSIKSKKNESRISGNNHAVSIEENELENIDIFVKDEEEMNEEKEFLEMNEENQNEILNNLKNEKL